jgi:hypothetical protein
MFDKDASIYTKSGPRVDPGKVGAFRVKKVPFSHIDSFHIRYHRRELPFKIQQTSVGMKLVWTQPEANLDMERLLPVFFNGIRHYDKPGEPAYRDIARQGVVGLLEVARNRPNFSIVPYIPLIIPPIREALATRDISILAIVLRSLQEVCKADVNAGRALVPFYRIILPTFNMFTYKRENLGDHIDYGQRMTDGVSLKPTLSNGKVDSGGHEAGHDIAALITDTLECLERHGGPNAFKMIKSNIPCYESCVHVVPCAPVPAPVPQKVYARMERF